MDISAISISGASKVAQPWRDRARAAFVHLAMSATVALAAAALILWLWFPGPFRDIAGGRELFLIVLGVDIVLGPLLTYVAFDRRKPARELRRDLAIIVALQVAGLVYGLHSVQNARPAVLALEGRRLRAVKAIDLPTEALTKAPPQLRSLDWTGMLRVATRESGSGAEQLDAVMSALSGVDIGARPEFWLPPDKTDAAWASAGIPISELRKRHPSRATVIDDAIARTGHAEADLKYLPIVARRTDHVALIDGRRGTIVGYAPLDGF
jgi:hypothetical protein